MGEARRGRGRPRGQQKVQMWVTLAEKAIITQLRSGQEWRKAMPKIPDTPEGIAVIENLRNTVTGNPHGIAVTENQAKAMVQKAYEIPRCKVCGFMLIEGRCGNKQCRKVKAS